jgi:hypothetical protein
VKAKDLAPFMAGVKLSHKMLSTLLLCAAFAKLHTRLLEHKKRTLSA